MKPHSGCLLFSIAVATTGALRPPPRPETKRREVLESLLSGAEGYDHRRPVEIQKALDLIDEGIELGRFASISDRIAGMASAAFLIADCHDGLFGAISLIGPSDRWTKDRISEVCLRIVQIVNSYPGLNFSR